MLVCGLGSSKYRAKCSGSALFGNCRCQQPESPGPLRDPDDASTGLSEAKEARSESQ